MSFSVITWDMNDQCSSFLFRKNHNASSSCTLMWSWTSYGAWHRLHRVNPVKASRTVQYCDNGFAYTVLSDNHSTNISKSLFFIFIYYSLYCLLVSHLQLFDIPCLTLSSCCQCWLLGYLILVTVVVHVSVTSLQLLAFGANKEWWIFWYVLWQLSRFVTGYVGKPMHDLVKGIVICNMTQHAMASTFLPQQRDLLLWTVFHLHRRCCIRP